MSDEAFGRGRWPPSAIVGPGDPIHRPGWAGRVDHEAEAGRRDRPGAVDLGGPEEGRVMTLLPGDIISTGTPSGVGPLLPGDVVEVEVEHVGVLRHTVVER